LELREALVQRGFKVMLERQVRQELELQVQLAPPEYPRLRMFKSSPHLELGRSQQEQDQ
jgi:hypothetical protein